MEMDLVLGVGKGVEIEAAEAAQVKGSTDLERQESPEARRPKKVEEE